MLLYIRVLLLVNNVDIELHDSSKGRAFLKYQNMEFFWSSIVLAFVVALVLWLDLIRVYKKKNSLQYHSPPKS